MPITAQAFKKLGSNTAIVAKQSLAFGGSDAHTLAYRGLVTFTLDGTATSAVVNWIDGTEVLDFTPTGVIVDVVGGNQGATALVTAQATAFDTQKATITFSATGTASKTITLLITILK